MNKLDGSNQSLEKQIKILEEILLQNDRLKEILIRLSKSNLKDYYVAAGSINQTVFNYYHDYDFNYGIEDFDIVYFDDDTSYEKEDKVIKYINEVLEGIDAIYDIKNEARVYLWYPEKYGKKIEPYKSVEDAISSWGTTITCLGVRLEDNQLVVCAPYGLNDLFNMTIRPVKRQYTKEQYLLKAAKWKKKWDKLDIISWESN